MQAGSPALSTLSQVRASPDRSKFRIGSNMSLIESSANKDSRNLSPNFPQEIEDISTVNLLSNNFSQKQ